MILKKTTVLAALAASILAFGASALTFATPQGQSHDHPMPPPPDPEHNAGGKIASISGNAITVERRDGDTDVILVSDATVYMRNRQKAALTDFKVGDFAHAEGDRNEADQLVAIEVRGGDRPPRGPMGPPPDPEHVLGGKVVAVDASAGTLTLENPEGTNVVYVNADTRIARNRQQATLADFKAGDHAMAHGERDESGRFIADGVRGGDKARGDGHGREK